MKSVSTIPHSKTVLLVFFFLFNYLCTQAQNPIFEGELAKWITEDSRPGWIKLKPNASFDNNSFLGLVDEGLRLAEGTSFNLRTAETDPLGAKRSIYQQQYKNIPVEGYLWILHERRGTLFLAQGTSLPAFESDNTNPRISASEGLDIALNTRDSVKFTKYAWEVDDLEKVLQQVKGDPLATHYPTGELVWVEEEETHLLMLAYKYEVYAVAPLSRKRYFIHAETGRVIKVIDLLTTGCFDEKEATDHTHHRHGTTGANKANKRSNKHTTSMNPNADVTGSGKANYVLDNDGIVDFTTDFADGVYTLNAQNLGPQNNQVVKTISANNRYDYDELTDLTDEDNIWSQDSVAIGAHWGTELVYDYYLNQHNRNSFDNNGSDLLSIIHYGTDYVNAFWNGVNMTYGDGNGTTWGALTSFDVIAHEITHGVTEHNGAGGLDYYHESGALNESFSDIFGVVFEFEKHPDGGDWWMGEDFDLANSEGFRNMQDPTLKGDPKTYHGLNWYDGYADGRGVHTNSGVQNFWFYLLSTGGSGTNEYLYDYAVAGIGREAAAAISYRNLTTYLHPTASYEDAMNGAIQSAIDLYGDGSKEHQSTVEAWCAVGVGTTCLPEITVSKPGLNTIATAGKNYTINWTSTLQEAIPLVKIEYTVQSGDNVYWSLIEDNVSNTGTYEWFVPSIYSTSFRIRVSDAGNPAIPRSGNPIIADESRIFNVLPCIGANSFDPPTDIKLNTSIPFIGNIPGDSFEWLIDGVSVATTKDFMHTFTDYGIYAVTYRVENGDGACDNIETINIYVFTDNVCEAQAINLNTPYLGAFNNASTEPNEPRPDGGDCVEAWCSNYLTRSIWYSFVAPSSEVVSIRVEGAENSYTDSKIALYQGVECDLSDPFLNVELLAANDNDPANCCSGSFISKACLVAGQTYHVQVGATFITGAFNITVKDLQGRKEIDESFDDCVLPEDWSVLSTKAFGIFSDRVNEDCLQCMATFWGGGDRSISHIELPIMDFSNTTSSILAFDYANVPQQEDENNELRVEVSAACGAYTTIFSLTGNDLPTNNPPTHTNGDFHVPTCEEIKTVKVDLSAFDGASKVSIRLVADGQWYNPITFDNIIVGANNETCRMQDSLVLIDIYTATEGANWENMWDLSEPLDSFYGVTLNAFGCVTSLELDGYTDCFTCWGENNRLTGTLPSSIWNLENLKHLSLSGNRELSGTIGTDLSALSKLRTLAIAYTNLNGTLPEGISELTNLTHLSLSGNQLTGPLPSALTSLSKLTVLNLSSNQFTGEILPSLTNLTNLYDLSLGYNQFTVLPDLSPLTNLRSLDLSGNTFGGTIPNWITGLENLYGLWLSNNGWTGNIPTFLGDLNNLNNLSLSRNQLEGSIPTEFSQLNFYYCSLDHNQLTDTVPVFFTQMSRLRGLRLNGNNFSGLIPDFSIVPNLNNLDIEENRFSFEDIIPHFVDIKAVVEENSNHEFNNYEYQPQQQIFKDSLITRVAGEALIIDLLVDDTVSTNTYIWKKNGAIHSTIQGDNALTFNTLTVDDAGTYTCEISNPTAPDLLLSTFPITLEVKECAILNVTAGVQVCDEPSDTYSQLITITYNNPPASGMLLINDQQVAITGSPQDFILDRMVPNGEAVTVQVSFTAVPSCSFAATDLFMAPETCITTLSNCDDNDDMIVAAPTNSGSYQAKHTIESAVTVEPNQELRFKAGQSITLKVGFHAQANSEFLAEIGDCKAIGDLVNEAAVARRTSSIDPMLQTELKARPNPFYTSTSLDYSLATEQLVNLSVYSMTGELIEQLAQEELQSVGTYSYLFAGTGLKGGMYLVLLQTDETVLTKKIILVK